MPELPEIRTATQIVNNVCQGRVFTGAVRKSEISKNAPVEYAASAYTIRAEARGKEMALVLDNKLSSSSTRPRTLTRVLFHFGMSGRFQFTTESEIHKHAHLMFETNETPPHTLSFVDVRRFGTWRVMADGELWDADRGPDPAFEYDAFRQNVLDNLDSSVFNKPICEVLLNQQFFNGIGNYLRCEILYRARIPPFIKARDVLEGLVPGYISPEQGKGKGKKNKAGKVSTTEPVRYPDLLPYCRDLPLEVLALKDGVGYDPDAADEKYATFLNWLQCYTNPDAVNVRDHNGRTMWFMGVPGSMVPEDGKTVSGRRACLTKPPPQDVKYSSGRKKGATKKEAVSKTPAKVKRLAVVVKKEEEDMAVTESDSDLSVSSTLSGRKVLAGSKRRGGQGKKPVSPSKSTTVNGAGKTGKVAKCEAATLSTRGGRRQGRAGAATKSGVPLPERRPTRRSARARPS